MKIDLSHAKDPAMAWNVTTAVTAESGEKIAHVTVTVNGLSVIDESPNPPLGSFQRQRTKVGQYPGDNKAEATVTDDKGNQTAAVDEWQ